MDSAGETCGSDEILWFTADMRSNKVWMREKHRCLLMSESLPKALMEGSKTMADKTITIGRPKQLKLFPAAMIADESSVELYFKTKKEIENMYFLFPHSSFSKVE